MFPNQADLLYYLFIGIGIVACLFLVLPALIKRYGGDKKAEYYFSIWAIISIAAGFAGAILFQFIYDLFYLGFDLTGYSGPGMTYLGGLITGAATFFLLLRFWGKKLPEVKAQFWIVLRAAAPCVLIAHAFGRIGCFCAGCCYGVETDSFIGMSFPGHAHKIVPTQLIEAVFLFALFAVCFYKKFTDKSAIIYTLGYGVFRFVLEFFRGDPRGAFLFGVLSPSQVICIGLLIVGGGLLYLDIKKGLFKKYIPPEKPPENPAPPAETPAA